MCREDNHRNQLVTTVSTYDIRIKIHSLEAEGDYNTQCRQLKPRIDVIIKDIALLNNSKAKWR